jgi:hypothetical protein
VLKTTGEIASIQHDSELAGVISRMRDMAREARDGRTGSPSELLKQCAEQFREMVWQVEGQKRRLEWGNADEPGPAGLVREMCAVVPTGDGAQADSPYRTIMLSLARTLIGAVAAEGDDAGYWEARAATHRVVGDAAQEELALVRLLAADYRRVEGHKRDAERRAPPRMRLLELLRAKPDAVTPESLPPPWPPVAPGELRLRRALLVAIWAVASPPDPAIDPAAQVEREKQCIEQLRQLGTALGEDDAARARERWAAP